MIWIFSLISIVYDSGSFQDVNCKYRMYLDEMDTITETVSDTSNPDFQHQKMFSFTPVTRQVKHCLNYFMNFTNRSVYHYVLYRTKIVSSNIILYSYYQGLTNTTLRTPLVPLFFKWRPKFSTRGVIYPQIITVYC